MYILTSKYFPLDYWPDLYFPALYAGVDIQYTEVMEFSVAAILSALFTLEMPVSAAFTVAMPMIIDFELYEELSA